MPKRIEMNQPTINVRAATSAASVRGDIIGTTDSK